jgi:hypothetical protein
MLGTWATEVAERGAAMSEHDDDTTTQEGDAREDVREDVVQHLLNGYREKTSSSSVGDFLGVEFSRNPPTDAERAEAHRRYVDELAEKGMSELTEPDE